MKFLTDNKKKFNIIISISYVIEVIIAIVINLVSQTPFVWHSTKNIVLITILIILVIFQITCNVIMNTYNSRGVPHKLKKAFAAGGGYEVAAVEMQHCIKTGNLKKFKDIRKMISMIEK